MSDIGKVYLGGILFGVGLGMMIGWGISNRTHEDFALNLAIFPAIIGSVLLAQVERKRRAAGGWGWLANHGRLPPDPKSVVGKPTTATRELLCRILRHFRVAELSKADRLPLFIRDPAFTPPRLNPHAERQIEPDSRAGNQAHPPNTALLSALAEIEIIQKDMNPTIVSPTQDFIEEARSGAMYGDRSDDDRDVNSN